MLARLLIIGKYDGREIKIQLLFIKVFQHNAISVYENESMIVINQQAKLYTVVLLKMPLAFIILNDYASEQSELSI